MARGFDRCMEIMNDAVEEIGKAARKQTSTRASIAAAIPSAIRRRGVRITARIVRWRLLGIAGSTAILRWGCP